MVSKHAFVLDPALAWQVAERGKELGLEIAFGHRDQPRHARRGRVVNARGHERMREATRALARACFERPSRKSPLISGPISGPTVSAVGPVISIR